MISVASFFLGVSTGVTGVEGAEERGGVSAVFWGLGLGLCKSSGARGLLHWSQYTRTCSKDKQYYDASSFCFCVSFPAAAKQQNMSRLKHFLTIADSYAGIWSRPISYLRFDIYVDFPLLYVDFVEFQESINNIGKARISYSLSVNRHTQTESKLWELYTQHLWRTHLCPCSSPALKFRVVYFTKFLFISVGYPVSQKFNEVQSGFKRVDNRRHVWCYSPLLLTIIWLKSGSWSAAGHRSPGDFLNH